MTRILNIPATPRVILLANKTKAPVVAALDELKPWLAKRAQIVAELELPQKTNLQSAGALPEADLVIVLGGDGTILALAHQAGDQNIPVLGVNFGKLGFLAEFNLPQLYQHWEMIISGRCRTSRRLMIEAKVFDANAAGGQGDPLDPSCCRLTTVGLNDAVITAGQPFRIIELAIAINPNTSQINATTCSGDGLIVSTPSGSTAYNLSAGGPIVTPGIDALCITPICPHSLAFRPIITNADDTIALRVVRCNPDTHLLVDGQVSTKLHAGEQVVVCQYDKRLELVQNPEMNYWKLLASKMHWAALPRQG